VKGELTDPADRNIDLQIDQHWMQRAIEMAQMAMSQDEVPVGAVIVRDNEIIGAAGNQRESLRDPTAHAEMISITQAAASMDDWRLEGTTLYVTLEPCVMCAGAILQARVPRVVFGAADPKGGAVETLYQVLRDVRLNHQCDVTGGVLAERCGSILTEFFAGKRALGKK
tara:strand:+ start:30765 stop:31271 length:507 start_codon:yes stop_codon:yes gene_type:complete